MLLNLLVCVNLILKLAFLKVINTHILMLKLKMQLLKMRAY